jgi:hypothetical protein
VLWRARTQTGDPFAFAAAQVVVRPRHAGPGSANGRLSVAEDIFDKTHGELCF